VTDKKLSIKDEREKNKRAMLFFFTLGYSVREIAAILDMNISSVKRMISKSKKKVALFREMADAEVEFAAFKSATGYTKEESFVDREGVVNTYEKYYPPNVQAQQFWLKNRKPQEWRDVRHYEFKKTLEKLGDSELLEVAKEMGIAVGESKELGLVPTLATYEKVTTEEISNDIAEIIEPKKEIDIHGDGG